jgi:uncharacterized repeat protein (TIGR03803 family)
MTKLNWVTKSCGVFLLWAMAAVALPAQTLTVLHSFAGYPTDGSYPHAGPVQAANGNLYGTAYFGGANNDGAVFSITPSGTLTTVLSFDVMDGQNPYAGLAPVTNGKLYGATYYGGANGYGTVFSITASGALTTLYSFDVTDGKYPSAGLVQATDGKFYGTTAYGGANGYGTVFSITAGGMLTTLHSFDDTDGAAPFAGLVQATDGDFYGTTYEGGANGYGTVFKITPSGTLTTLHSFDITDGDGPNALVQATDGSFYGTTIFGGANTICVFGCGTVFSITASGMLTTLHSFDITDGSNPEAGLVQATNGKLYGTTSTLGANGYGTVFSITASGALTTLHSFAGCPSDGADPNAGLVQGTNGTIYGTTYEGGAYNVGSVFSLSVGLGPFVETLPTSGMVGETVKILGTELTGATSVTFNGTPATFTVNSESEITTTVPTGATTGTVQVVTPRSGTLSSNVPFRVTP